MNRLGKALVADTEILSLERIMAEVDAVTAESVCELCGILLAPERLSVAGIGPERGAVPRGAGAGHAGARSPPREDPAERVGAALAGDGEGRRRARAVPRGAGATSSSARRRRPRRWSTSRRPAAVVPNVMRALAAGLPCVVGTTGLGDEGRRRRRPRRGPAGLPRAELRDRGGADDALRGRGVAAPRRAPRSSSCTTRRSSTRPRARRRRPRPRWRATSRSTRCGCRASSRTRR